MADFIAAVFFFNLIFGILLFIVRHRIPITTPVLVLTALISFTCTISFPYLAARLDYPGQMAVFLAIIIFFALILSFLDNSRPVPAGNTTGAEHNPSDNRKSNGAEQRVAASISAAGRKHPGPGAVSAAPLSHGQKTPVLLKQAAEQPASPDTANNLAAPQVEQLTTAAAESAATISESEMERTEAETQTTRHETAAGTETEPEPHAKPEEQAMEQKPPDMEPEPAPGITMPEETAEAKPPQEAPPEEAETTDSIPEKAPQPQEPPAHDTELQQLLAAGFASKQLGHYEKAIKSFKQALQMQPEPKLAILTLIEMSEIYGTVGQYWQAAEILRILLQNWRSELDRDMIDRLEQKIKQLHGLFKQ